MPAALMTTRLEETFANAIRDAGHAFALGERVVNGGHAAGEGVVVCPVRDGRAILLIEYGSHAQATEAANAMTALARLYALDEQTRTEDECIGA